MILLIDNYDSFSYNLYQLIGEIEPDIRVIRNDEMTIGEIRKMNPGHIILSPGPGRPENAGIIIDTAKTLGKNIPLLGVCLGHQAICAAFGATGHHTGRIEDNSSHGRRRNHGGTAQTIPHLRSTVPPRINHDAQRQNNAQKFYSL